MALPTFDFSNLVSASLHAIFVVVKSPIFYFTTLTISFGVIYNRLYDYFINLAIPKIPANLAMPTDYHGGVVDFFLYMFNVETLVDIFNGFISVLNGLITFLPGVFIGVLSAVKIYMARKSLYETTKGITKH